MTNNTNATCDLFSNGIGRLCMTCVVLLAATLHQTASANTYWLKLHTVTVDKPRERSGDRPYFIAIEFRSRLGVAGSTRIQVREDEPHDWSGKRHYRNGLTTQRDHLFAGEAAPIPFWMGEFEWANVNVTQPSGPLSVVGSEFIGLILVAVDNNNLPPHVMRDFVNTAGDVSRRLLVEQIEQNGLVASREGSRAFVRGDTDTLGRLLGQRAGELALQAANPLRMANWFRQATVGSTFNPDKPLGMYLFLMPTIANIEPTLPDGFLGERQTIRLPEVGTISVRSVVVSPSRFRHPLLFEGAGGRYRVDAHMFNRPNLAKRLDRLVVQVFTGGDGKRSNSGATAIVTLKDGTRVSVPLAPGREIAPRTVFRAEVNAPPGFRYCDIGSFELAFSTRKSNALESYDDWDVHGINLHAGSSMVFSRTPSGGGAKVHRFSRRDRVWRLNLGIPSC
jgi:hypothetical protein